MKDIVQGDVRWAILMNFSVDLGWLVQACPHLSKIPKVFVLHGSRDEVPARCPPHWDLFGPKCPDYGTHHSKAALLAYDGGIRVAIFTANFLPMDHDFLSNAVWVQDFPKKNNDSTMSSEFQEDLIRYMSATRWPGGKMPPEDEAGKLPLGKWKGRKISVDTLRNFDYSGAGVKLIASVPGWHKNDAINHWGQGAMRAALSRETFPARFKGAPVVCQFSSLGSTTENWIKSMRATFCEGNMAPEPGTAANYKTERNLLGGGELKIVWPTLSEVGGSILSHWSGMSIPGNEKNVKNKNVRDRFHRWRRTSLEGGDLPNPMGRENAAPHIKTFLRYDANSGDAAGTKLAWLLLTSHNLSKSAWGEFQQSAMGERQLAIKSFELGVLFLPSLIGPEVVTPFSCTGPVMSPATCLASVRPRATERGHASVIEELTCVSSLVSEAAEEGSGDVEAVARAPLPYHVPPQPYDAATDVPWMWNDENTELAHQALANLNRA